MFASKNNRSFQSSNPSKISKTATTSPHLLPKKHKNTSHFDLISKIKQRINTSQDSKSMRSRGDRFMQNPSFEVIEVAQPIIPKEAIREYNRKKARMNSNSTSPQPQDLSAMKNFTNQNVYYK